jgi:carboxylesterase type B
VKGFVGNCSEFENDSLIDREPVQFFESGRDMIITFGVRENHSSKGILNTLESRNSRIRKSVEKRITVIESRRDE